MKGKRRGGEPESKNEDYDSVRKTDNNSVRWRRNTEAEILIDRELHKANRVFPERTLLKYCLASSVKAGFTLGMEKQMGCLWAMGYMWEVKGCWWELYATAIVCQSFFNLSCSPNNTSLFLAFISPPTNAAALRKLVCNSLSAFCMHLVYYLFFHRCTTQDRSAHTDMQIHILFMYV